MPKFLVFGLCAMAAAMLALAGPAFADMKRFNAAIKAGNYKEAAAEAKATWTTWDKTHADTAVVAREFGFASYVAGDYQAAREFGQFLNDRGATLPTPDDLPVTSRVLLAAANFRLGQNDQSRSALLAALSARNEIAGLDQVSLLAAEALYRTDWASGNWQRARESGRLASQLINRGGEPLAARALAARASAAAASFLAAHDKEDYDELVDAHDAVVAAIDAALDPRSRASLAELKFQLQAWVYSVEAYFNSSDQIGSNIPKKVKNRELKQPQMSLFPDAEAGPDRCRGMMDARNLRYPQSAMFKGMVGTVIMKYDFDEAGVATKSAILASVPAGQFAEAVKKADVRLKRAKEDTPNCRLDAKDRPMTFIFVIG